MDKKVEDFLYELVHNFKTKKINNFDFARLMNEKYFIVDTNTLTNISITEFLNTEQFCNGNCFTKTKSIPLKDDLSVTETKWITLKDGLSVTDCTVCIVKCLVESKYMLVKKE